MDRNITLPPFYNFLKMSLSVRRAWIEMGYVRGVLVLRKVALRKESVDRNTVMLYDTSSLLKSLSVRRAWIEMPDNTHRQVPFRRRSP